MICEKLHAVISKKTCLARQKMPGEDYRICRLRLCVASQKTKKRKIRKKPQRFCIDCGEQISSSLLGRCEKCYRMFRRHKNKYQSKGGDLKMKTKVKPCPWCGSQPKIVDVGDGGVTVRCISDKCKVKPGTCASMSQSVVVNQWNKRLE